MTTEKLNAAIQLIHAGNRQAAVLVLRELIQENTSNENAWLWLSVCMDDVEHKKFCLQSVLTINPANLEAREALAALTAPVPAPVFNPVPDPDPEPELASWVRPKPLKMDEMSWDVAGEDEVAWTKAEPKREKMEWEKAEPDDVFWRKVEPERVSLEKMEWEEDAKVESAKTQPPPIAWDAWDEAEPVGFRPLKQKVAKAPAKPVTRRKMQRRRSSFVSMLAGLLLFIMFCTVSFVFLAQVFAVTP